MITNQKLLDNSFLQPNPTFEAVLHVVFQMQIQHYRKTNHP